MRAQHRHLEDEGQPATRDELVYLNGEMLLKIISPLLCFCPRLASVAGFPQTPQRLGRPGGHTAPYCAINSLMISQCTPQTTALTHRTRRRFASLDRTRRIACDLPATPGCLVCLPLSAQSLGRHDARRSVDASLGGSPGLNPGQMLLTLTRTDALPCPATLDSQLI